MRRLLPRSLHGQVLAVIAVALALAQALSIWLFADERELAVRAALAREALDRAANVMVLIERAPPGGEAPILAAASSPLVHFSVTAQPALDHSEHAPGRLMRDMAARFGPGREVRLELHTMRELVPTMPGMPREMREMHRSMGLSAVELQLSVGLTDGRWLNVTTRFHRPPLQWAVTDVATFLISALFLGAAVWLLLRRITRPLARLAAAADRLGHGDWVDEIAPSGPAELARLTLAFNRMQARLRRFVDERARLLAALGHDLRSPLTALRVRAEMVEDDETRTALIASINEMQEMVEATLTYARGAVGAEPGEAVELGGFLAGLVGDYAETGQEVTLTTPPEGLVLCIRPIGLRRALRNLIDNALRYGARARLSVEPGAEDVRIHIDDDGPGIPEADISRVFEPFLRLEGSRSRETGGTGLGLAIARTVLRAHGGDVMLANRAGGGLRATAILPRGDAAEGVEPEAAEDRG